MLSARHPFVGSSPLARGLPAEPCIAGAELRIIPARARFTSPRARPVHGWRDHPRSRGVYSDAEVKDGKGVGSSPLARGLRYQSMAMSPMMRIIPARAGFTFAGLTIPFRATDHPRSRGVYPLAPFKRNSLQGSSPLARGLPLGEPRQGGLLGIIPARAGFTRPGARSSTTRGDHPRSRGVYRLRIAS